MFCYCNVLFSTSCLAFFPTSTRKKGKIELDFLKLFEVNQVNYKIMAVLNQDLFKLIAWFRNWVNFI